MVVDANADADPVRRRPPAATLSLSLTASQSLPRTWKCTTYNSTQGRCRSWSVCLPLLILVVASNTSLSHCFQCGFSVLMVATMASKATANAAFAPSLSSSSYHRPSRRCASKDGSIDQSGTDDTTSLPEQPPTIPRFVGFDLGTSGARISVIECSDLSSSSSSSTSSSSSSSVPEGRSRYREVHSDSILWSKESNGREKTGNDNVVSGSYDDASAWIGAVRSLLERASSITDDRNRPLLSSVKSICVSGTSASCLVIDATDSGKVTRPPRMYDYDVVARASDANGHKGDPMSALKAMDLLDRYAPPRHTARARTGALAKLLTWHFESPLKRKKEALVHQADYVSMQLTSDSKKCGSGLSTNRRTTFSDWHNCLKLGYNVNNLEWPDWMIAMLEEGAGIDLGRTDRGQITAVLPSRVVSPGEPVATISSRIASEYGLPNDVVVVGGTTDSNAAFFAAAGSSPPFGTAVTSLGSTLALKLLSSTFVEDAERGVYSHRFPIFSSSSSSSSHSDETKKTKEAWLVGGASNVGCAVLRQQNFTTNELVTLSDMIDPNVDSSLSYYPLTKKGERFPTADPERMPKLEPMPSGGDNSDIENRKRFLHGILQGIGDVEREGYRVLGELGATPDMPEIVLSCGGGARNAVWRAMRQRRLADMIAQRQNGGGNNNNNDDDDDNDNDREKTGERNSPALAHRPTPPVLLAENAEASYGAAVLASATFG